MFEHKFRHNFKDMLNTLRSCSIDAEIITHFFLRCHFHNEKRAILKSVQNINKSLPSVIVTTLVDLLLCGNEKFNDKKCALLICTIRSLKNSRRFAGQLD